MSTTEYHSELRHVHGNWRTVKVYDYVDPEPSATWFWNTAHPTNTRWMGGQVKRKTQQDEYDWHGDLGRITTQFGTIR